MTEKRFHYDYKTGRMKDTQSNSQATSDMRVLERIINDACYSYEKKIKELRKEVLDLRAEVGRLNSKKEVEIPHWLKYESSKGYTKKVNQDIRFDGDVK